MNASHLITRASVDVVDGIRASIDSGKVQLGRYLPSERTIASEYGVSGKTVRRALKVLEMDGLLSVEPRKGYKVIATGASGDHPKTLTVAFLYAGPPTPSDEFFYHRLLGEMQLAAGRRKLGLLGLGRNGRAPEEILAHIKESGAGGVILNAVHPELLDSLQAGGIPTVMVDAWFPDARFDAVIQDGFSGGFQAAEWLASRGHKDIAFFGRINKGIPHNLERLGGAMSALAARGMDIPAALRINLPYVSFEELLPAARELLSKPDRPTGILALWQGPCHALVAAARELNLTLGKDLDVVGWSTEEDYPDLPPSRLAPSEVPPMMVWSMRRLADAGLARLLERRAHPTLASTTIKVPVSMRLPKAQEG